MKRELDALMMIMLALDEVERNNGLPAYEGENNPASFIELVMQYADGRLTESEINDVLEAPLKNVVNLFIKC